MMNMMLIAMSRVLETMLTSRVYFLYTLDTLTHSLAMQVDA